MSDPADLLDDENAVAIIGIGAHFPGARNSDEFWCNIREGVESLSFPPEQGRELDSSNSLVNDRSHQVRAGGFLEGVDLFDAAFFGYSPREAEIMDPQQRLFLECAWEALENAGYEADQYGGLIGVYAGASMSTYLLFNLATHQQLLESVGQYQVYVSNDKDFLATRVSYKLNLRGPSITVQSACSSALVAVHLACQSLLMYQCDMALAGGVSIHIPQAEGYIYHEGGILSPDGHCRAFDANAQGTVPGNGVGIVVLKRFADAFANGDTIHAVIRGSAVNNDGAAKVGFTAPSIDGQAEVIALAHAVAGIQPDTITYIEAHGTGTKLGDPIEIAALTQAFRAHTQKTGFCAIGSVKTNIGHLDVAAGIAGLIKAVLALKHKMLPPTLNFERPNPAIDFATSPFYINTALTEWKTESLPRRAGVSAFGFGGTNAHIVLEEAPASLPSGASKPWQLLVLSAATSSALEASTVRLVEQLRQGGDLNLADIAYTSKVGRKSLPYRRMTVCNNLEDTINDLATLDPERVRTGLNTHGERPVAFLLPGQGTQYINMARELYQVERTFREQIDTCVDLLHPLLELDLRSILYPQSAQAEAATQMLGQTYLTQPTLFVIEYALARSWIQWGVSPKVMIGHSLGEYVAACLANVFSLEDALMLVAKRGLLMQRLPQGVMLSVALSEEEIAPLLDQHVCLAAVNGPSLCTLSGPAREMERVEAELVSRKVSFRRLKTSHAFHSEMMTPIMEIFADLVNSIHLTPPSIPYLSNVTGTWITAEEATDPNYWAKHLRQTVRFAQAVHELVRASGWVMLEVGPGRSLSTLARQIEQAVSGHQVDRDSPRSVFLPSVRESHEPQSDIAFLLNTCGQLWLAGVQPDWSQFYTDEKRHRVPLPTYPFEHQRYWIEPKKLDAREETEQVGLTTSPTRGEWLYTPSWKRSSPLMSKDNTGMPPLTNHWLVFVDDCGIGTHLVTLLRQNGHDVTIVKTGKRFARRAGGIYTVSPKNPADYVKLIADLQKRGEMPQAVVHLWSISLFGDGLSQVSSADVETYQDRGFYSLLSFAQALAKRKFRESLSIHVVSNDIQQVTGEEDLCPAKATILGPCRVIPQEYPNITCRSIDIMLREESSFKRTLSELLFGELTRDSVASAVPTVAYRGRYRWVQTFEPFLVEKETQNQIPLRERGVYLIIGGLGNLGLVLAEYLADKFHAQLILVGRSPFPNREEWEEWLKEEPEDPTSQKIRKLQAIEELGSHVEILRADAVEPLQLEAVITTVRNHYGAIHGIIHAAGISGERAFRSIQEVDRSDCIEQFEAKVFGLMNLAKVLHQQDFDFVLVMSSLSSILGGLGLAAYSAANRFMDAFVQQQNQCQRIPWISVNWDRWRLGDEEQLRLPWNTVLSGSGIPPRTGAEIFHRIISQGVCPQVIVSTGHLQTRIKQWVQPIPQDSTWPEGRAQRLDTRIHPAQGTYVAPRNEIDQAIASLLQDLLGVAQIGVHDSFFEIGGHSLLATQAVSRLRTTFSLEIPLRSFFEHPTIAGMAEIIERMLIEEIEGLTEQEAQELVSSHSIKSV